MNYHSIRAAIVSRCPLCSSDRIRDTHLRTLDETRAVLLYECGSCTGRFVADRPERNEKAEVDAGDIFTLPERFAGQRAPFDWKGILDENDYSYSIIPLIERWSPGRRVLSLGYGASQLLPMLTKRGFHTVGFEIDHDRAQAGHERRDTGVSGDWRNVSDIAGKNLFDCIVSDRIFEHMLDPVGTLRSLKPLLATYGVLISRFSNEGSWRRKAEVRWARIRGNHQPLPYSADHLNYFNERAARMCFAAADCEILRMKRDLRLDGCLARNAFSTIAAVPSLQRFIASTIAVVDNNVLSNGLTAVARPRYFRKRYSVMTTKVGA